MGGNATNQEGPDGGGEPQALGKCTECGSTYPVQHEDGGLRPIGVTGTCECGNDEFEPVSDT